MRIEEKPSNELQKQSKGILDQFSNRSKAVLLAGALTAAGISAVLCNGGPGNGNSTETSEDVRPNKPKSEPVTDENVEPVESKTEKKSPKGKAELVLIEGEADDADYPIEIKEDNRYTNYVKVKNWGHDDPKPEDLDADGLDKEVLVMTDCESMNDGETLTSYKQLLEIFRRPKNTIGVTWASQDATDLVLDSDKKIDGEKSCKFSIGADVADHKGKADYGQINEWFWAGPHQTIDLMRFVDVGTINVWLYIPEGALEDFDFLQVYIGNNDGFEHPETKKFIEGNFWIFYADAENQNLAEGWNEIQIPIADYAVQKEINGVDFSSVGFMAYILRHHYPAGEIHEGFRLDNITVSRFK